MDAQEPVLIPLKPGTNFKLEEEADKWLAKGREGVTAQSEKRDYFTRDQLQLRASREITNPTGTCDESLVRGLYRRSYNPNFGHRPRSGGGDD